MKESHIKIDESRHTAVPTFFQRVKNALKGVFMGIIFSQVMFFAFRMGSLVLWWDNAFYIAYILICAFLGAYAGDKFIETLRKKSGEWWNIWGFWRL